MSSGILQYLGDPDFSLSVAVVLVSVQCVLQIFVNGYTLVPPCNPQAHVLQKEVETKSYDTFSSCVKAYLSTLFANLHDIVHGPT